VIGLDCAAPELVFDRWLDDLPALRSLAQGGARGRLRSIDPPITIPAWSCMLSGLDPGQLGVYGFRNRRDHSYDRLSVADSRAITAERVWDTLGRHGRRVIVLGVPGTYPPPPVNGLLVSCFLTPDPRRSVYTYPAELGAEIAAVVGDYQVDVVDYRSEDRARILAEVEQMTDRRFDLAEHLLATRPWDFFAMVEIGLDRIHHAFWKYLDPAHRRHEPGHPYASVIHNYYCHLDRRIGRLLDYFDAEDTVLVVSDHGALRMEGAVCVNDWLLREGYLALAEPVAGITPLSQARIDWGRTRAWGEGGYYCRLCLNVRGREPQGVVDPAEYEVLREELISRLEAMASPDGAPLGTRVHRPESLWPVRRGVPPDLVVYFGNLSWRSIGSLGHDDIFSFENDTGPDDANHGPEGILIMRGPGVAPGWLEGLRLYDVAATILDRFGLPSPPEARGRPILSLAAGARSSASSHLSTARAIGEPSAAALAAPPP